MLSYFSFLCALVKEKVNLHASTCIYKTIHLSWQWLHSYTRLYFKIKHGLTEKHSETDCTTVQLSSVKVTTCLTISYIYNLNIAGRWSQSPKNSWLKNNTIYAKLDNRMYDRDSLHKGIYCTLPLLIRALPCKMSDKFVLQSIYL